MSIFFNKAFLKDGEVDSQKKTTLNKKKTTTTTADFYMAPL